MTIKILDGKGNVKSSNERSTPETFSLDAARAWTRRSRLRLPLDIVTCIAMLAAVIALARGAPASGEMPQPNVTARPKGRNQIIYRRN